MYHRNYTTYFQKELEFLKSLVSRFHEQERINELELTVALQKTQDIYEHFLKIKFTSSVETKVTESPPIERQPIIPAPEKIVVAKEEPVIPVREETKRQVETAKATILAEKIKPLDFQPINETLAQQKTGSDLSSKLQTTPLTSIVSGIGLNDKFLYIRELFGGDGNLYNNAVKYLDTVNSLEEALNFINSQFDWDENNETVQKFVSLVHRRHV